MSERIIAIEKIKLDISVNAPAEAVWKVITGGPGVDSWCKEFPSLTVIQSDWKEGSFVLYLDDFQSGVIGVITKRTHTTLEISYKGLLNSGYEDFTSESAQALHGAGEKYTVTTNEKSVTLKIEADVASSSFEKMNASWRNALEHIKKLAENQA
ncbi:SRPBCC family protein [Pseudochryseolinea flava]|uniref:SRPBCC domain-containing protein n=1 Tax=Pseudochryseolinea flava TaxID=2059302 RepID=A0A364XZZ2_9BACT|nr:hypothetical protein [Pseudochryseolinea flava]RAV99978.1 hypothetical protein DQQ10_15575 [Pseudochryseolinea flava]